MTKVAQTAESLDGRWAANWVDLRAVEKVYHLAVQTAHNSAGRLVAHWAEPMGENWADLSVSHSAGSWGVKWAGNSAAEKAGHWVACWAETLVYYLVVRLVCRWVDETAERMV